MAPFDYRQRKEQVQDSTGRWKRARDGRSTGEYGGQPHRPSRSGHGVRSSVELGSCWEFVFYSK